MSVFSWASLQGSSDERDIGVPLRKVSTAHSPHGATSDATLRDQKQRCSPPVRPHSGAPRRTDPGEVEEMEYEEGLQGDGKKKGGCVGEELERKGGGDGCPRKDRHYLSRLAGPLSAPSLF